MDEREIVARLRHIYDLALQLRQSDVPIVQNYALTVLVETRAVLAQIPQMRAPERLTGLSLPDWQPPPDRVDEAG